MAVSRVDMSAADYVALGLDCPILIAGNTVRDATAIEWRSGGSWASGSDETEPNWLTRHLYDGHHHLWTRPNYPLRTTYYLLLVLPSVTFDAVAVLGHNFGELSSASVQLQVADDNAFTTNLRNLFTWSSSMGKRLVSVQLGIADDLMVRGGIYSGVVYARLKISCLALEPRPKIGELWLGTAHQLPHKPNFDGFDEDQYEGEADVTETVSGRRHHVERYAGRRVLSAGWSSSDAAYDAIFRDSFEASRYGRDPVLYIPRPSTDVRAAYVMRANDPQAILQETDPNERDARLAMLEVGPYASEES